MTKSSRCSKKISNYFGIKYTVEWKNVKYPRLEFSTPILHLILPRTIKEPRKILDSRKDWLIKKHAKIENTLKLHPELLKNCIVLGSPYTQKLDDVKKTREKFRRLLKKNLKPIISSFSKELGVEPNKIFIKCQKTKWASCSTKKNLSFNLKMLALPQELMEYLVYHELLHLKEKRHNSNFVRMLRKRFPNFVELEKDLFTYWFALESNKIWMQILGREGCIF
ncbi:MAG: YgjP-like metallopeptidase domain-containing protein [Thermoplasmatales archaeon]